MTKAKSKVITPSDLTVEPYYAPADRGDSSVPGEYPYTRGIHRDMYRGKLWTMRQYAGFGTAAEANERYKFLLGQGTTGLSVAFDLPTQMGRDADHQLSRGEVGKVGVSISTLDDMRTLLKDIPLDQVSISMTINATAGILLGLLLVVAEERKIPWTALRGTIQNDVLKEYIARGTYIYPPQHALRIITDIFEFCGTSVPQWNTISVSGYHIREAGSTAIEEVAFTLADGIAYVEAALSRGLKIDEFAPRIAFFFNCHNDFFEEIAKFRAARRIWAKIMKDRFKAKDPKSQMLRFHTQTAGSSLTAQQPLNNVVRTTVQALAAVCGGTQSLHTNSYDEALGLPTEESATIALRTQQVIACESGAVATADPLGGSYYVEQLTDTIEKEAEKRIAYIDSLGGMVRAIEIGYPQKEIDRSAYEYQRKIENQEQLIVGVNQFIATKEIVPPLQKLNPKGEDDQRKRLSKWRTGRDQKQVDSSRGELLRVAREGSNLMPAIVSALRCGATLGELSDDLRQVFGEHRPSASF